MAKNPILSFGQERLTFPFFVAVLVKFQVMGSHGLRGLDSTNQALATPLDAFCSVLAQARDGKIMMVRWLLRPHQHTQTGQCPVEGGCARLLLDILTGARKVF